MRITGGDVRGLRFHAPAVSGIRPTSDRVRGALFGIIGNSVIDANVLDLYSGTGALGMEALSRGASSVDFIEQNSRMCGVIRSNLELLGFSVKGRINRLKVENALDRLSSSYNIVLVDPPYNLPDLSTVMYKLDDNKIVEEDGWVILEHSSRVSVAARFGDLSRGDLRRYGDTTLSIYRRA